MTTRLGPPTIRSQVTSEIVPIRGTLAQLTSSSLGLVHGGVSSQGTKPCPNAQSAYRAPCCWLYPLHGASR